MQFPIHDGQGVLLLAAGTLITGKLIDQLIQRQIEELHLNEVDAPKNASDVGPVGKEATSGSEISERIYVDVSEPGSPVRKKMPNLRCAPYDDAQTARLTSMIKDSSQMIAELTDALSRGTNHNVHELSSVVSNYLSEMTTDPDNVVSTVTHSEDPLLAERCVRLSSIAMAIGIEFDYDAERVCDLSVCGLVHDWGLYKLPERFRDHHAPLTPDDWEKYRTHPYLTVGLLQRVGGIPNDVRIAATQVHELSDGSGYPKGLTEEQIHPYARILAVADMFISLTCPSRGRPAFTPYDAMKYLLNCVKNGRLSAEPVRALLKVLSLFPIGSQVQLSDGSQARVLRRNADRYRIPIIERMGQDPAVPAASRIVPAIDESAIDTVIPRKSRKEMRIDDELMDAVLWDGPSA